MLDTHLCSGCNTTFTLRGYQSHLLQTKNPLCRAVYDRLKKSSETYQLLEQGANPSNEAIDDDNNHDINMEGGSDHSAALENLNQNFEEVLDEDGSELEDIDETGWEPPRDGAPQEDALAGEDEPADTSIRSEIDTSSLDEEIPDSDNAAAQHNFDRYIIGDGYGVKPAVRLLYTDKYPSSQAGKPLSHENSRDRIYSTSLGGGDNPWAPFHSKKDWEIARWAKVRGVGSTAFSDILAIDGVGFFANTFQKSH